MSDPEFISTEEAIRELRVRAGRDLAIGRVAHDAWTDHLVKADRAKELSDASTAAADEAIAAARLRALCEEEGVDGAVDREDDSVRTVAVGLVRDAHAALLAGPVTVSDIRAGMNACRVLAKRRPKLNRRAFDIWMARLISGVGNPPPADLTEEDET